jgi:hypothetical protein
VAQLHELRGDLQRQMEQLARDRRLDAARLALRSVEERIRRAVQKWQVLATADFLLDAVRRHYETERQPQTLRDASNYLNQLTLGQHVRVWAPLDERSLRVDDPSGRSQPLEELSRGTRESVLLALRLALAEDYARRGAKLPLVWDDVLVNLDAQRVQAAVQLLKEFSAAGHQVLLLTCHEHIVKSFRSARVPVRQLPARGGEVASANEPAKKPRRSRRAAAKVEPAPAIVDTPVIEDEAPAEIPPDDARQHRLDPPNDGAPPPPKKPRRAFTWQSPEMWVEDDSG